MAKKVTRSWTVCVKSVCNMQCAVGSNSFHAALVMLYDLSWGWVKVGGHFTIFMLACIYIYFNPMYSIYNISIVYVHTYYKHTPHHVI